MAIILGKKTLTKDHHIKHFIIGGDSFYFDNDTVICTGIDYSLKQVRIRSVLPKGKYRNSEWIKLN